MNKYKFSVVAIMSIVFSMLVTSCATIFAGGSPKITVDGNINEPVTITTTKQTYTNVTLPYVVRVKRHGLDGQRIYVQSETTRYRDIVLEKSVNSWTYGNLALGGLFGWLIDLGTNAVSAPAQSHFYINANDVQGESVQSQPVPSNGGNNYNGLDVDVP